MILRYVLYIVLSDEKIEKSSSVQKYTSRVYVIFTSQNDNLRENMQFEREKDTSVFNDMIIVDIVLVWSNRDTSWLKIHFKNINIKFN